LIRPERQPLPAAFHDWLCALGLFQAGEAVQALALQGGVSSDIWQFEYQGRAYCVKRALPRLKVEATWEAPLVRNAYEADWLRYVHQLDPSYAPGCLANDVDRGMLLMPYLPASDYRLWKSLLFEGQSTAEQAKAVGFRLAHIHAVSAKDPALLARFDHMAHFHTIRLEPYLLATAIRHPDLLDRLSALAQRCARTKKCLIHGDVSPKNLLISPRGPMFLDAECACWGDPAFDMAFCLNHLLLKRVWVASLSGLYHESFHSFLEGYREGVARYGAWEDQHALERRAADLLPALSLARIDGKSPVEYIQCDAQKAFVRHQARAALAAKLDLEAINEQWLSKRESDATNDDH